MKSKITKPITTVKSILIYKTQKVGLLKLFYLYDWLCGDVSDDFQQVGGLSTLDVEGVDDELGALVQVASGDL